jgi:uncharacterized protein YbjT (DUF2867 family)
MTEQSKILVTGATGNVGRELVSGLLGILGCVELGF